MSLFSLIFKYKDRKSPDKLGLYPEKLHIAAFPERRYLWTSRLFVISASLSIAFNIFLVAIIYVLLPQKTSFPYVVVGEPGTYQLEDAQPFQKNSYFMDLLTEGYIEEYIKERHAIPKSSTELYYRWDKDSKFYWYSSSYEYHRFINRLDSDKLAKFIKLRVKRYVEIDYIKKITNSLWVAQFKTATSSKNSPEPDVVVWRAYLRIYYEAFSNYEDIEKTEREKDSYTNNPFGFKVASYHLGYAGKNEAAYSAMQTAKKVFESIEDVVK